jgi:lipase maturation factor 1
MALHSCFGLISLAAFISIYIQYHGLYGPNGLQPIENFVSWVSQNHLPQAALAASAPFYEKLFHIPSLIIYAHDLNLRYDIFGEFLLILGMISSSFISLGFHSVFLFIISWICYLSLFIFGQAFLNFQWDMLLLEVGFLAIFSSFFALRKQMLKSMHWCYRFLIWKLMFMAGVVKLQANCPTWLGLTALEVT